MKDANKKSRYPFLIVSIVVIVIALLFFQVILDLTVDEKVDNNVITVDELGDIEFEITADDTGNNIFEVLQTDLTADEFEEYLENESAQIESIVGSDEYEVQISGIQLREWRAQEEDPLFTATREGDDETIEFTFEEPLDFFP